MKAPRDKEIDGAEQKGFNRRTLLQFGGLGAVAFLAGLGGKKIHTLLTDVPEDLGETFDDTPPNKLLFQLRASSIPHVRSIQKSCVPGAEKAIIIFKDIHDYFDLSSFMQNQVRKCQQQNMDCIQYCMESSSMQMRSLYKEGVTDDIAKAYNQLAAMRLKDLSFAEEELGMDASLKLAMQLQLEIRPGENEELNAAVLAAERGSDAHKKVQHQRDQFVFNKVANDSDMVSYILYGSGHNFIDDQMEWNKAHPEKKISVAIFKTYAVRDVERLIGESDD